MKKRNILGSAIVVLLMLMSTQTVFLNVVRSDPSEHTGDAFVGNLWISELDVSSDLTTFDDIGIAHVNATDDYCNWPSGNGNITANWSVDIDSIKHPEFFIGLSLVVYNVDDNNSEIGNDSYYKTYNANTTYDESGTFSTSINFSQDFLRSNGNATLVCYLGVVVVLNNTVEAVNFTNAAHDRAVVGICFTTGEHQEEPFSMYVNESNDIFPPPWSWLPNWNVSGQFDSEDDMLNTQTFFSTKLNPSTASNDWNIGEYEFTLNRPLLKDIKIEPLNRIKTFKWSGAGELNINLYFNIDDYGNVFLPFIILHFNFIHEGTGDRSERTIASTQFFSYQAKIEAYLSLDQSDDTGVQNTLLNRGRAWLVGIWPVGIGIMPMNVYTILIDGKEGSECNGSGTQYEYLWEESCAYNNGTRSLTISNNTISGITTVSVDLSNLLNSNDEYFYTYSADSGDTRIEVSC
jgi:hypothetical protein